MNGTETIRLKTKNRRLFERIIAILLICAMIPGLVIYPQTGVNRAATRDDNRSIRLAARQLLRDDPYANRSRIGRMSDFARNLLGGKRSFEDLELAVQISIAQGRYEEALAFQEKAMESFSGSDAESGQMYLKTGYLCVLVGEYEKALNWLNLGIRLQPGAEAILTRAQVRLNLHDTEGAIRDVDTSRRLAADPTELIPDMVNIYEAAGAYETALQLLSRVIDENRGTQYLLDRIYCLVQLDRMEEAETSADRYLAIHGGNAATTCTMLATGFLRRGDYKKADAYYARAMSGGESDPYSLYYYVVLCAYLTGDYARAAEYGEALIGRMQGGGETGMAQLSVEDVTGKVRVDLKPVDFAQLCRMTGASRLMTKDYDAANRALTLSLEEKEDPYVRYLRGSSLLAQERFREALADLEDARKGGAEEAGCRYAEGICRMQLGETSAALSDFSWVREHAPDEALREEAARQMEALEAGKEKTTSNSGT